MHFKTINDVTLHYQVIGAPEDKPTIVFINSSGTDFRIWRDVIIRLVGDYSIVSYDKRGHGLSDQGKMQTMDDHIEDLAQLLDHLGIQHGIICGLSIGGLIAQGLYHKRTDLVGAMILCHSGLQIGSFEMWNRHIEMLEREGMADICETVLAHWFSKAFQNDYRADIAGYLNMFMRTPLEGYKGACAAIRDADFTALAGDIKIPTICIAGEFDKFTPPDLVKVMAKAIPGAFYEEIKDCGHMSSIEKGDYLSEVIKAFMAKLAR